MHKNNLHNEDYDFPKLCAVHPQLKEFVFTNKYEKQTINFAYPQAVKIFNTALLKTYYNIKYWNFSDENLCPPIPSRVDYIHNLNDLLNENEITSNPKILDIGTGATCIYPILGNSVYNWEFVGTEIDKKSMISAQKIIDNNNLNKVISLRLQPKKTNILYKIIRNDDFFDAAMCNPPFYSSKEEADDASQRKLKGLGLESIDRNFSGMSNELWYEGGEKAFIHSYIHQSTNYKKNCRWFTTLVSKKENVSGITKSLEKIQVTDMKIIQMKHGNKVTRIIAWTFM